MANDGMQLDRDPAGSGKPSQVFSGEKRFISTGLRYFRIDILDCVVEIETEPVQARKRMARGEMTKIPCA